MTLPVTNMVKFVAAASRAAPKAKTRDPMATARERPMVSESEPANNEPIVAESIMIDTTIPCWPGERCPKYSVNVGIVVTGPMTPVSRLLREISQSKFEQGKERDQNPFDGGRSYGRRAVVAEQQR